jgi:hypothetical protein
MPSRYPTIIDDMCRRLIRPRAKCQAILLTPSIIIGTKDIPWSPTNTPLTQATDKNFKLFSLRHRAFRSRGATPLTIYIHGFLFFNQAKKKEPEGSFSIIYLSKAYSAAAAAATGPSTSSIRAIGALSPIRLSSFRILRYPPGLS